jgi:restriction system protein
MTRLEPVVNDSRRNGARPNWESLVPIPDFQSLMLPLLEVVSDGKDHLMKDVTRALADRYELTEEERRQPLPSGQQTIISNRVAWAKAHMKMAGLIENPLRGYIRISPQGSDKGTSLKRV